MSAALSSTSGVHHRDPRSGADVKGELIALKAELGLMVVKIDALVTAMGGAETPPVAGPEPRWMTLKDYRAARSIRERTLQGYIAQGLPTIGEGHGRRVVVAEADKWLSAHMGRPTDVRR